MIQVGQVLDKYELLERVGQGGMAVVYRGLDRSLKRVVAVKVLHKHLSDYQEARDRFEREAQAVAKLRHENILEIFDYSGADAAEVLGSSYIVTEFIDGQTLKQLVTDRPIAFPEIGAMLMLQVCRALAHAHSAGILHRDVKPENVMIRSDGVVKLMDFGISHMVDLERLTVTGQLLGSPAYMAPEHVEGRPLDFRTDVFAAGIVLYQLTVGRLPFEGKNPHEVLKRIAECKYVDPRQVNPRIGNRLGRIIVRAMAGDPNDRFPSVGEMVVALEAYLEESGIAHDKVIAELGRYFQSPAAYERALEDRLIDHLTRRGQQLLDQDDRAGALDVFDRVLTIDADNEKVIAILDGINRRTRMKAGAVAGLFIALMGVGAFAIHKRSQPPPLEIPAELAGGTPGPERSTQVTHEVSPPSIDAPDLVAIGPQAGSGGSGGAPEVPNSAGNNGDAASGGGNANAGSASNGNGNGSGNGGNGGDGNGPVPLGSGAGSSTRQNGSGEPPVIAAIDIRVTVSPRQGSEVRFGDGDWLAVPESGTIVRAIDRAMTITARNPCCEMDARPVRPGQTELQLELAQKPGWIIARCDRAGVDVQIDGKPAELGKRTTVFFDDSTLDQRTITVVFLGKEIETRKVKVRSGFGEEVQCKP